MPWMKRALILVMLLPAALVAASGSLPSITPQDVGRARARLYLDAAHEPLAKLAQQIYQFAADSERCRLNSGTQACGLPETPLKDGSLKGIFDYYVKQPVESILNQQHVVVRKSDWTWRPSANPQKM